MSPETQLFSNMRILCSGQNRHRLSEDMITYAHVHVCVCVCVLRSLLMFELAEITKETTASYFQLTNYERINNKR